MVAKKLKVEKKGKSSLNKVVTREYTIHLHKRIHGMYVLLFLGTTAISPHHVDSPRIKF